VVFVFSASVNLQQQIELNRFYTYAGLRQIIFFPAAIICMLIISKIDYHWFGLSKGWFRSPTTYLLVISVALLVVVLIPSIGAEINYARRWFRIPLGPARISFQPSELAKWVLVFFLAGFCDKYSNSLKLFWKRFVPMCCIAGLVAGLILIEDFGTAALVAVLTFLVLTIAGVRWWHITAPVPLAVGAFAWAILSSEERRQRILAFLHPDKWTNSINYQPSQSLIALGSGGIWGKGLGRGICKYGHLPEDTTDFIFAIIGEEMGLVGTISVVLLFIIFVWLGLLVVIRCHDLFGQLLAAGIVLIISIQAAINIGVVTVVLPTKGMPLPFISSGGTSLLLSAFAIGVLLNIAKQSGKEQPKELEQ
jgi:cell division protein FtsW